MLKQTLLLFVFVCLLSGTLLADAFPFAGAWKLNPSRSRLTDEMKVEVVGPNKYAFTFTGDNVETVIADGTDQPGLFGGTLSVTVEDRNHWKVVRKSNGRITITGMWELSDDGNTLTDSFTSYRANGSVMNLHYIYKRTAGVTGFPGAWESTTEQVNSTYEMKIEPYRENPLSR